MAAGLLDTVSDEQRGLLRKAPPGAELAARPMLGTLSDRREFPEQGWVFERKLWRGLAVVRLSAVPRAGVQRHLSGLA
jgi:hypothetical protein